MSPTSPKRNEQRGFDAQRAVARAPSPFSDTLAIVDEWLVAEGHLAQPAVAGDSWPYERTSALIAAQAHDAVAHGWRLGQGPGHEEL